MGNVRVLEREIDGKTTSYRRVLYFLSQFGSVLTLLHLYTIMYLVVYNMF